MTFDNEGCLYAVDCDNSSIKKFTSRREYISKFGVCGSYPSQVKQPTTVFIDNNLVYIVEYDSYRISMFDTNGSFVDCFGIGPHPDYTLLTAVCSLFFYLTLKL